MMSALLIEVLGTMRGGEFTPAVPRMAAWLAEPFVIGSRPGPGPTLILNDSTVSRQHAQVYSQEGTWRIRDLHSDNGLFQLHAPMDFSHAGPVEGLIGEHVREESVTPTLTVAVGAVLLRLTASPAEEK
jgi:hypothetical protein